MKSWVVEGKRQRMGTNIYWVLIPFTYIIIFNPSAALKRCYFRFADEETDLVMLSKLAKSHTANGFIHVVNIWESTMYQLLHLSLGI